MRQSRWGLRVVAAVMMMWSAGGLTAVAPPPARAAVTSISPSSARVTPGQGATATVRVQGDGVNCVEVRVTPEEAKVGASVDRRCSDEASWTTGLSVSTTDDTPAGTYLVEVRDRESSATFRLEVAPAPPPPTTTVPPTTTAPPTTAAPTTVTVAPATTAPAAPATTDTTAPAPTTTAPALDAAFASLASLVDKAIPSEGLFLPLVDPAYRVCLPLTKPCAGPESALVLVPARAAEVRWGDPPPDVAPPPALVSGNVPPLEPVGVAPPEAAGRTYVLFVLDLAAPGGRVAALPRGLDEQGALAPPTREQSLVVPVAEAVEVGKRPGAVVASTPFARPYRLASAGLTEASPALVVVSGPVPQLLFGVRADPVWGLNREFVALLGNGSVPYLVRGPTGPPGLFVPVPEGLDAPPAPTEPRAADDAEEEAASPAAVAGLVLAMAAVLAGVAVLVRRRRPPWPSGRRLL
ncbi:MAG: hypothetical protein KY439_03920 [Actinobacteria bacterium]|nr:hypothetical protein [Actinomycetota bacterium]